MPLEVLEHNTNTGRGNLLGIQPSLTAADYATHQSLHARLDAYLQAAAQRGWLSSRTIVVFPEYLGAWLAAAGERPAVLRAPTLPAAMRRLALAHPLGLARQLLLAREPARLSASLFRLKAASMARRYQAIFGGLARQHAVTIVGGSLLLPSPAVRDGRLLPGRGPLQNVLAVFAPDGAPHPHLVRKAFPTAAELPFVAPAPLAQLPAFDTPAGRLGVLICADSWRPAAHQRLAQLGVDFVAVPSFIDSAGLWDKPWAGYNGAPAPADVDPADIGRLTEGQAWRKYALAGRLPASGARCGLNVFLRGTFWDLSADSGCALAASLHGPGLVDTTEAGRDGAAILNLWLP